MVIGVLDAVSIHIKCLSRLVFYQLGGELMAVSRISVIFLAGKVQCRRVVLRAARSLAG